MISRPILTVSLIVILFAALLLNACKPKPGYTGGGTATTLPTIFLDSLSITGADFTAKLDTGRQNIIFNYFLADTAVTLRGWILKKGRSGSGTAQRDTGSFNPTYDLKLNPIGKSRVSIGPNTYLGNQVLLGKTEKKILNIIKGKNAIIYFNPMKDTAGRISYTIRIKIIGAKSTTDSTINTMNRSQETFTTNPAPPHQAFD